MELGRERPPHSGAVSPAFVIAANGERSSFSEKRKILSSASSVTSDVTENNSNKVAVVVGSMEHIYEEIPEKVHTDSSSQN